MGFHKDNADRLDSKAPDWQVDRYPIIRIGIYTQDDDTDKVGGLDLRAGSHLIPDSTSGKYVSPAISVGDVIFWNFRTSHSAGIVKLKVVWGKYVYNPTFRRIWANLPISPMMQKLPSNRVAMFVSLAAPHPLTDRYLEYVKHRTQSWQQWAEIDLPDDVKREAQMRGLTLIDPREFKRDGKPVFDNYTPIPY